MKSASYILFIDESGKSSFFDSGKHFLLSGLIINKDLHSALSSYMISLKEKSGIPTDENIHAFNLFEDEKLKRGKVKHPKIDEFFDRLTPLMEGADMRCLIFRVDKSYYQKQINRAATRERSTPKAVTRFLKRNNRHDFLYELLTRRLILEFGRFLEHENATGEVVAESRRQEDDTVLRAFISATSESTYPAGSHCRPWALSGAKRIHSLTFQNKKGLSFGLEVADLFGWAHFNTTYGRIFPIKSAVQVKRVERRLTRTDQVMRNLYHRTRPEDMTPYRILTVGANRVSEFTELLRQFKGFRLFGDTTR